MKVLLKISQLSLIGGHQALGFVRIRPAGSAKLPGKANSCSQVRPALRQNAPCQTGGCLDEDRIIRKIERLQRRAGRNPPNAEGLATGSIKRRKEGIRYRPSQKRVNGAAIAIVAGAGAPLISDHEIRPKT